MITIKNLIYAVEQHNISHPSESEYARRITHFLEKNGVKSFHNFHWDDGHITASMLISNLEKTKVLLMFHKKFQKWLQFGGHSDDSIDVLATAIREFHEESGIQEEPIICKGSSGKVPIFDIDIHDIPPDNKGRPAHKHYDIRFLGLISDTVQFQREVDEVDDIKWVSLSEVDKFIEEDGLMRMINKIKNL